jgi:hypothetical protein
VQEVQETAASTLVISTAAGTGIDGYSGGRRPSAKLHSPEGALIGRARVWPPARDRWISTGEGVSQTLTMIAKCHWSTSRCPER